MNDITVSITDEEIEAALEEAKEFADEPRAVSAEYVSATAAVMIHLSTGGRLIIPREDLQGLENATPRQLAEIQLWGGLISLSWPQLDVDHYLPHLLEHRYGSDACMEKLRV